jgi:hypothetical protein
MSKTAKINSDLYDAMLKEYYESVEQWAKRNNYPMSEHAIDIASKILAHRDKALPYPPGGFIHCFLSNDFEGVMTNIGSTLKPHLFNIFKAWYNIDSYEIKFKYFPEKTGLE